MSEIKITGPFAVPEGENFKLIPCQEIELTTVHQYLESIYNHSFKDMKIRHILEGDKDYLVIDDAKILDINKYKSFIDELKKGEYSKLFKLA